MLLTAFARVGEHCRLLDGEQRLVLLRTKLRKGEIDGSEQKKHDRDDPNGRAPWRSSFLPVSNHFSDAADSDSAAVQRKAIACDGYSPRFPARRVRGGSNRE